MAKGRHLEVRLLPKQLEAYRLLQDKTVTELLYGGSAGSGKSDFGCTWVMINALAYPGSRWLIGRSKLSQLKSTTMKTFKDVAKRYGVIHGTDWQWTTNSNEIQFANGSEIVLKDLFLYPSDPDFDSLGSLEITGAFIDEASQIVGRAFSTVKSRIRYKLNEFGLTPKILMTCNPSKNFLYESFYLPWKEDSLPTFRKFIRALPTDNKFLPSSYLEELRRAEKVTYQRLYLGNWEYDDDPSAMIQYDKILALYHNSHIEVDGGTQLKNNEVVKGRGMTVDPAYKGGDSTVILVWSGLKVIDSFEYHGAAVTNETTIEQIRALQTRWNVPSDSIIIDVGGGYGNAIWEAFPGSYRFNGAAKSISGDHNNLRTECFYRLADAVNSNEIWFPAEDSQVENRVTQELEQLRRDRIDQDGKLYVVSKEVMKEGLAGRSPDYLDALSMRMMVLLEKKPAPSFTFFVMDV